MEQLLSPRHRLKTGIKTKARYTGGRNAIAALIILLMSSTYALAQTRLIQAPPTAGGNSALSRGPNGSVDFQRTAVLYRRSEVPSLPPNTNLTHLGFYINTPAAMVASGSIKIYLVNTTDATYNRGNSWANIISTPTAMVQVYNGPLTIPTTAGPFNVTLQTPFNYTGNNFYLAYEWNATTKSTTSANYLTNVTLPDGLITGTGTTAPATLTGVSAHRPVLQLGYTPPANDLNVAQVFSLGKLPMLPAVNPHIVSALVINSGRNAQSNVTVSLSVTGANTFNTTTTIASIPAGDTAVAVFPGYTPTATGNNTITVSVPNDDYNDNNSNTYAQVVTTGALSYAEGNPPIATTGLRPLPPNGTLLARYKIGNQSVTVPTVRLMISTDVNNVGKTVYAVIQDITGTQVARSADYVIQTADLNTLKDFTIINPPVFTNTDFFAGMGVVASATTYFPMGVQSEPLTRFNTFYSGPLAGGSFPGQLAPGYRLIVEPVLAPFVAPNAEITAITSPVNACSFTATEQICITILNSGGVSLTNIPVSYSINGSTTVNETFAGPLAPGASANYCFSANANLSAVGPYTITATVNVAGDADATDNSKTVTVNAVQVGTVTAQNVSRCGPGPVTLNASAPNGDIFVYYDAASGGNEVGAGSPFTTGNITANTTFYVQGFRATQAGKVGPASNTIGAGGFGNFSNFTTFNALVPMRLDSVKLFSNGALTATIGVFDTLTGDRIDSVLVNLPAAGEHTVFLGFDLPAGNGYGLQVFNFNSGTGQLYRNTAGATFPYTLPGVVSITGTNFVGGPRYYYFYDWSVSTRTCPSSRVPVQITINALPATPTITAGGATTFCQGGSVTLNASTTTTGVTYQWNLNGTAIPGATSAAFTANAAGNYTVTVTGANSCFSASSASAVTVNTIPATPTITQTGGTLTSSAATGNQWYLNSTAIPGATGQTYVTAANGAYTVVTTAANGCPSATSATVNVTNTGITQDLAAMQVQVYPNPASGIFKVKLTGHQDEAMVTLYSITGKQVLSGKVKAGEADQTYSLKGIASGTYVLKITSEKGVQVSKLIVQ